MCLIGSMDSLSPPLRVRFAAKVLGRPIRVTPVRKAAAGSSSRLVARLAVVAVAAMGIGLSACSGSGALPLSASARLPTTISGKPGSRSWCSGVHKTAESLLGLGRGESYGVAARIVRKSEHRVVSALHGLPPRSTAASALQGAVRLARRAVSELLHRQNAGLVLARRTASQITLALTRLPQSGGASC